MLGGAESGALGRSGPRSRGGVRTTPQLLARGATGLQQPGLDTVHKPLAAAATAQARARADAAITLRGSPPTSADAAVGRATRRRGPARLKERCSAEPRISVHYTVRRPKGEGEQGRLQNQERAGITGCPSQDRDRRNLHGNVTRSEPAGWAGVTAAGTAAGQLRARTSSDGIGAAAGLAESRVAHFGPVKPESPMSVIRYGQCAYVCFIRCTRWSSDWFEARCSRM